jgi:hypothetical protein
MRKLVLITILIFISGLSGQGEETIDSRVRYILDCYDHAQHLEKQGYSRVAYTMLTDCRNQWVDLHHWAPDWNPELFNARLSNFDHDIASIKIEIANQPSPPDLDQAYRSFLDITLESSSDRAIAQRRLTDLIAFRKTYPNWEPKLIAAQISETEEVLGESVK